jgi:hypothetical protein
MPNVNEMSNVVAWKNTMPGSTSSLHVTGSIMAPTPCHEPILTHVGDSKSNPPVYLLKLEFHVRPGMMCIQVVVPKSFHYIENNYAGRHQKVEISAPGGMTASAQIETVS